MTTLGKYQLHEQLGKGGFGTVYRATDTSLGRPVALKILHPQMAADAEFVERFRKEARLAAALESPHVVTIYEVGEQDGRYFIAMRYYPGGSLADLLKLGPLTWPKTAAILAQVCEGLQLLHAQGWVHRDLKPSNILFDAQGRAVVADFGLARALITAGSASSSGGFAGTPHYKAPELWRGKPPASPATDVYALGCILGEMLTGEMLFPGDTPDEVMTRHVLDGPEFGGNWPPQGVPEGLQAFLDRALTHHQEERIADAQAFSAELTTLGEPAPAEGPALVESDQTRKPKTQEPPTIASANPSKRPEDFRPGETPEEITQPDGNKRLPQWLWVTAILLVVIFVAYLIGDSIQRRRNQQYAAYLATETAMTAEAVVGSELTEPSEPTKAPEPTQTPEAALEFIATEPPPDCTQIGQTWLSPNLGMELECVPAGEFRMGSDESQDPEAVYDELPQRAIDLDAFWIDKTEVTNEMFTLFIRISGYITTAENEGRSMVFRYPSWLDVEGADWQHPLGPETNLVGLENHPVVHVSWEDAQAYCAWAMERLPSEAEWEKAARGTDGRTYPWGFNPPASGLANLADSSTGFDWLDPNIMDGFVYTSPVNNYPNGVSPYGALDMAGNVWEWVNDYYAAGYYADSPGSNPPGAQSGDARVLRGGSWYDSANYLRAADRYAVPATNRGSNFGFRCAMSATP